MKFIIEKTEVTRKEVDIIKEIKECVEGQEYLLKNSYLSEIGKTIANTRLEVFKDILNYLNNL